MNKTIMGTGVAVAAAGLLLTGCNSGVSASRPGMNMSSSAPAPAAAHNDADVSFAQQMIPHHQQAVTMADMAAARASSAQVKGLASRIQKAQGPEIQQMTSWLDQRGAPTSMPAQMPCTDRTAKARAKARFW